MSGMDAKQLPHEFYTSFRSMEDAVEKLQRNRGKRLRTQKELTNPKCRSKVWESRELRMQIYCGGSPRFFEQAQGDAAVEVEDDGERCGDGGARATEGLREEEGE